MFLHALAGARAAGLALFAAALLAACGSDESPQTPAATPAASRLVVDTGSAAPVAGGTLTLKATLLAADGTEVKGATFAWTSSDPTVATVLSASDKAPAASASVMAAPVGIYAMVQTLAAGVADITAMATLADGTRITSVTHLVVQAAPAKSYTLALTPATVAVAAGGAAQTVTVAVRRSDGVDGAGDLTHWSWMSDDASFVATPAADGRSAQVASPATAYAAGAATLTACADAPAGVRLCANAALSRNASLPPTYTVGGTVSGLATGKSLQLADTNGDTQVVNANGGFIMPTARLSATAYAVTVAAQPAGQTCTVSNGAGTVAAANVANVAITCVQAQFVVVANQSDSTLSVYRIDPTNGRLAAVPGSPFAAGGPVNDLAFLASGLTAYGALNTNAVTGFSLDPATGAMAPMPGTSAPIAVVGSSRSIVINPSGQWLYVSGQGSAESHSIGAGGTLAPANNTIGGSGSNVSMVISTTGQYLYMANMVANVVLSFDLGTYPGSFALDGGSLWTGSGPNSLALSRDGSFLYSPNVASNDVSVYGIDPLSGSMAPSSLFVTPALAPADIALTPSRQFAYVLGSTSNNIAIHQLDLGTGSSTAVVGTTPASTNGRRLRIEPNGKFLYTPSLNGALYGFAIDGATGALTAVPGSPFPAGNGNVAIAIVEPKP